MRYKILSLTAKAMLCAAMTSGPALAQEKPTYTLPGVEISGFTGDEGNSGAVNIQIPIQTSAHRAFFLGLDANLFNGSFAHLSSSSYNVGAYGVLRQRLNDAVVGGWLGADIFRSQYGNTFPRFIAGGELFTPRLIGRINGFVPLSNDKDLGSIVTTTSDSTTRTISDIVNTGPGMSDTVTTTTKTATTTTITDYYQEFAPSGIDAELGLRHHFIQSSRLLGLDEARVFGGGYRYFGLKEDRGDVTGVRGRLELDFYPFESRPDIRVTTGYELSHDDYVGTSTLFSFRVAALFGSPVSSSTTVRLGSLKDDPAPYAPPTDGGQDLFQPVRRNVNPLTARRLVETKTELKSTNSTTTKRTSNYMSDRNLLCGGTNTPIQVTQVSGVPLNIVLAPVYAGNPSTTYSGASFGSQTSNLAALGVNLNSVPSLSTVTSPASIATPVNVPVSISYGGSFSTPALGCGGGFTVTISSLRVSSASCTAIATFNQTEACE